MEGYNELWSEFCKSGSVMSYLSYKQIKIGGLSGLQQEEQGALQADMKAFAAQSQISDLK